MMVKYVSALFNFIDGMTPRAEPLTLAQQLHLVTTVARIHRMTPHVPLPPLCRRETFAVRWDVAFADLLGHGWNALIPDVQAMLAPQRQTLGVLLTQLRMLGAQLRTRDLPCVLCHTDIHGWNTIVTGDTTHLLDFEGLVLAPAEQDLCCWFDDPRWPDILATYRQVVGGHQVDSQALWFYQLKRYLEDIYEWVAELVLPDITQASYTRYAGELQRDLRRCDAMLIVAQHIRTRACR
jgi:Ser/Thr protein kinase RdoA (MazF antagonist)